MSDAPVSPAAVSSFWRGYDSAFPIPNPPAWEVALVYIGGTGLTPHVWDDEEIAAQPVRYINPTWVCRMDAALDTSMQGDADAASVVGWLKAHGAPAGSLCTLDTETLVLPAYIAAFDRRITANGFQCMNYGSLSYVTQNPLTSGGRFSADWRDIPLIDPGHGIVSTQYADATQLGKPYDASLYDAGLALMPKPGAPVQSTPSTTEAIVNALPEIAEGAGMPPAAPDPNVKTVQGLLLARGLSVGPSGLDGRFGAATRAAVVAFQTAHGLAEDGIVGTAETWPGLLLV